MRKMSMRSILFSIFVVSVLAFSALGLVAAQDDTTSAKPFLGVTIAKDDAGALVTAVVPSSAADDAGLKNGDVITAVNGESVTAETLTSMIQGLAVGDEITLDVLRAGETSQLTATLGTLADRPALQFRDRMQQRAFLGVSVQDSENGAEVIEVSDGSGAAEAGLKAGDVITAVNDTEISDAQGLTEAILALNPGDTVTLTLLREEEPMQLDVTLGSAPFAATRGIIPMIDGVGITFDGQNWIIESLPESSPLYEAGLRAGDVLTAIDGEPFDLTSLPGILSDLAKDGNVTLTVTRDGESMDIDVPIATLRELGPLHFGFEGQMPFNMPNMPDNMPFHNFDFNSMMGGVQLGVSFVNLNEQTAKDHGVDVTEGALITEVLPDTPAEKAGLQVNDIVTAVNGDVVDAARTLPERLYAYDPGDTVTLDVIRDGETVQIDVTLGQRNMMPGGFQFSIPNGRGFRFGFGPNGFSIPDAPAEPATPNMDTGDKA